MDPTNLTFTQQLMLTAGLGLIVGLVPLIIGLIKRNIKYALIGFAGSIIGGAVLGLILAIPVAAVSTWLILRGPKPAAI